MVLELAISPYIISWKCPYRRRLVVQKVPKHCYLIAKWSCISIFLIWHKHACKSGTNLIGQFWILSHPMFAIIRFALSRFLKLKLWFQMYSNNKHGNFSNCSTMAVILFFVLFFAPRWQVDVCCCLFSCGNLTEKTSKKIKTRCYHYNYPLRVNNWVWNSGILTVTRILFCYQKF